MHLYPEIGGRVDNFGGGGAHWVDKLWLGEWPTGLPPSYTIDIGHIFRTHQKTEGVSTQDAYVLYHGTDPISHYVNISVNDWLR